MNLESLTLLVLTCLTLVVAILGVARERGWIKDDHPGWLRFIGDYSRVLVLGLLGIMAWTQFREDKVPENESEAEEDEEPVPEPLTRPTVQDTITETETKVETAGDDDVSNAEIEQDLKDLAGRP